MGGEEKGERVGCDLDTMPKCDLAVRAEADLVRPDHFSETQEGVEASEQHGRKQQVVV